MPSAEIVFEDGGVLVPFVFDCAPEERHRASAVATEHEVERGVSISDHVRPERTVFSIEVVISDTPLFAPDGIENRAVDAWDQLLDAQRRALLAVVTTPLRTYEDMALIEAVTTRRSADGTWIRCDLTFAEIRQVSTELVDDPVPARARDHRQEQLGSKAPYEAPARLRSLARQGLTGAGASVRAFLAGGGS